MALRNLLTALSILVQSMTSFAAGQEQEVQEITKTLEFAHLYTSSEQRHKLCGAVIVKFTEVDYLLITANIFLQKDTIIGLPNEDASVEWMELERLVEGPFYAKGVLKLRKLRESDTLEERDRSFWEELRRIAIDMTVPTPAPEVSSTYFVVPLCSFRTDQFESMKEAKVSFLNINAHAMKEIENPGVQCKATLLASRLHPRLNYAFAGLPAYRDVGNGLVFSGILFPQNGLEIFSVCSESTIRAIWEKDLSK
jgi:hypothetical protein